MGDMANRHLTDHSTRGFRFSKFDGENMTKIENAVPKDQVDQARSFKGDQDEHCSSNNLGRKASGSWQHTRVSYSNQSCTGDGHHRGCNLFKGYRTTTLRAYRWYFGGEKHRLARITTNGHIVAVVKQLSRLEQNRCRDRCRWNDAFFWGYRSRSGCRVCCLEPIARGANPYGPDPRSNSQFCHGGSKQQQYLRGDVP